MAEPDIDMFAPIEDDGWNTDEKCPWCKASIGELYEYIHDGAEDFAFDCPSCEKPIAGEVWTQFILKRPRKLAGNGKD